MKWATKKNWAFFFWLKHKAKWYCIREKNNLIGWMSMMMMMMIEFETKLKRNFPFFRLFDFYRQFWQSLTNSVRLSDVFIFIFIFLCVCVTKKKKNQTLQAQNNCSFRFSIRMDIIFLYLFSFLVKFFKNSREFIIIIAITATNKTKKFWKRRKKNTEFNKPES